MSDINVMIIQKSLSGGGAERVATNLASCLSQKCNVVQVVICGRMNTYGSTAKMIDLGMPMDKGKLLLPWHYKVYKAVKKLKKEHNITHSISFMTEPDLANVLSKGKEKVIISCRNKQSSSSPSKVHLLKNRWVFSKADAIVSLSKMIKQDLIDVFHVDSKIITPIYNPCYVDEIQKSIQEGQLLEDEEEFFRENKGRIVISAGRLSKQKGQWHLIRAFHEVLKTVPDAKLVILGQGDEKEYLQSLVEDYGIAESVRFLGYKRNPYLYLANSDLFAFSSVYEGLGNILVECMACGLPIVSADCPYGPKELLDPKNFDKPFVEAVTYGEFGILTPPVDGVKRHVDEPLVKSEKSLAEGIVMMLMDTELRRRYKDKIIERGKDFNPDSITQNWLDVLENL